GDAGSTITGVYTTQYQITFAQSGIGTDTGTNTVVTVDGSPKSAGVLSFSKFVDVGATVTYAYSTPVSTSPVSTKQYRLFSTSGPASGFTVSGAATVTGTYVTQYQVTFAQTGIGTDTGTNPVLTLGGSTTFAKTSTQ